MSFQPFENPVGFGASDFLELLLAALLFSLILFSRPWIEPFVTRFSHRTGWCMLLLAVLPVALRLILLPNHPIPSPDVYDEFGHLLVADTLRHLRLANPPHPQSPFFETFFVIQDPTYSSIYPIGQGLALAIGRMLFGTPWAGVLITTAAFCSLTYWMLRAWVRPVWALLGGILAIFQFGPLGQWMNTYWGGSFAAAAGCLVFGALPRLKETGKSRYAVLLSLGGGLSLLIRPYESIFLTISAVLYFLPWRKAWIKPAAIATLVALPAVGVTVLHDRRVTGHWLELPYTLSQYQYGVPAALTFQPDPVPHRELTPQQELEYKAQLAFRGSSTETLTSYLLRFEYRVRFYRFFFLAPLFLVLPFFIPATREFRFLWVVLTLFIFALGINFFPAFQFHYLASVSCLFLLVSVVGLERLSHIKTDAARLVIFLCVAYFGFWYTLHLFDRRDFSLAIRRYETWDAINHQNPERRIAVNRQLASIPGKLLVFVRYSPQHIFQDEWVYNEADIDAARIVWARDLGASENDKLLKYYPGRATYLLEPDVQPPQLEPYP
jgi:hypothetical protein